MNIREFNTLREFARDTIPMLLLENGGCMQKDELHQHVERLYLQGRPMPGELARIQTSGCRAARNSIAWALSDLVVQGVLAPSSGRTVVCLPGAERARAKAANGAPRDERMPHEERVKARAESRLRARRAWARKHRVPFDDSLIGTAGDQIERQGFRCAATHIPFDLDDVGDGAGASHYAPSPDRIVPALGYVAGNVRYVLWMVNRAKGRMTEEQFHSMCRAIAARCPP
jgi:hypothetical protein